MVYPQRPKPAKVSGKGAIPMPKKSKTAKPPRAIRKRRSK